MRRRDSSGACGLFLSWLLIAAGCAGVDSNLPLIREQLTQLVCQVSGGPCTYLGADMKTGHSGMGVSNADFDAVVEDLIASLDKFNVAPREKSELLALLAKMRSDIVEKQ